MWGSYSSLAWAARAGERRRCVCAEGRMLRCGSDMGGGGRRTEKPGGFIFNERGLFTLPNWAPAQQHFKPVSSTRMLTPPLVQHVAPRELGMSLGTLLMGSGFHTSLPLLLSHTAGSPILVTPGHCSLLALCWTNPAVPKLLMEKRGRKVGVANMFTNHFGWWPRALCSLHSSTTSLNIWWSWNLCTEMQMLVETSE